MFALGHERSRKRSEWGEARLALAAPGLPALRGMYASCYERSHAKRSSFK